DVDIVVAGGDIESQGGAGNGLVDDERIPAGEGAACGNGRDFAVPGADVVQPVILDHPLPVRDLRPDGGPGGGAVPGSADLDGVAPLLLGCRVAANTERPLDVVDGRYRAVLQLFEEQVGLPVPGPPEPGPPRALGKPGLPSRPFIPPRAQHEIFSVRKVVNP